MRPDMSKVITERPRHGMRIKQPKGYRKEFADTPWEDQPKGESIRLKWLKNWQEGKQFSERLGPLQRWFFSKVGEDFDAVHSELCEHLSRDSVIQDHVRDHADQMVEKKVVMKDGVPYHDEMSRWLKGLPLRDTFYVCPETNKLLYASGKKRRWEQKKKKIILNDAGNQIHKFNGIWYEVITVKYNPKDHYYVLPPTRIGNRLMPWRNEGFTPFYDVVMKKTIRHERDSKEFYGDYLRGVCKRQLNTKEIRKLGLR